ncbi:MAG TPA: tripartite tricarboxylate transporter substrate binding protein [Xanthobacteraceae bacterium]|nr:tripartite tricarboxylate transporter substrate binding protein [Xanthobacteraceae bacterium]
MLTRRRFVALSATSAFAPNIITRRAHADSWPNRPVHLIVPIAAGGPTDSNARLVAKELSKIWGQDVVIDNKGGAGTNIGNEFVAHADPDGYTILYGTSSLSSNGALYRTLGYSPTKDLAPVSLVAKFPFFMFVPNSSPAKSVKEFIDYAKANPGKLIMGSPGTGSGPHLTEVLFMQMAHIQMTHAPYRGAAPAFIDLIPGRINCYFGSGELLTYSRSGQVRVLGSSGVKRSPAAPDVPTIGETVPGYEVQSWQAIFAPAKTPPDIIQKMNAGVLKALAEPALVSKFENTAYTPTPSSTEELGKFLAADTAKWSAVIKSAGLRID